jgi:hypothetical protein
MTREEAKELLPIIQAFAEGKTIEERVIGNDNWEETDEIYGGRNNDYDYRVNYRIKPTPKYRPFKNAEECWNEMKKHQPFGWVKCKDGSTTNKFMFICDISDKDATFNNCIEFTYDGFLENYVFTDGTPFGILEEE